MSTTSAVSRPTGAKSAPEPTDLITAAVAAKIAGVTSKTLARWSRAGRLKAFVRPWLKKSAPLYSRAAILALRPVER